RCGDAKLRLYNGYTTTMSVHTREWCGRHSSYSTQALKYVSNNNKVILRFFPGHSNLRGHRGFKLLWMAVTLPETTEPCAGFRCKGGRHCHNGAECTPLKQYCISKSLVCDGVRNCGPFDDSDERKCTREVIIMASCIAV
ncbi:uncharacterized protein LOC106013446, partial [Aplysia californica]|uniref:Uncharacterized protein LOC106013446 n=1 Tax=Aplysia californica TaxID=6500 RepID=A0ABM1ABT1_APLCA